MKQGIRLREQGILLLHPHRSHIADLLIVQVRLNFVPEVGRILHNAGDQQSTPAQACDWIARCTPLSGWIRPMKMRCSPLRFTLG